MKRCNAKPYDGNENYIFVSYCHKDKEMAFPIIERLARDGYRVWYDEGIDPGSEWPEIIARHLNESATCVALVSEQSIQSHNCRREITFALLKEKNFISVILEPVTMSLGMEMQLSANQSIFKYKLDSEESFFEKLYGAKFLSNCKGEANEDIIVSKIKNGNKEIVIENKDPEIEEEIPVTNEIGSIERVKTGEIIKLPAGEFVIGRSKTQAQYVIEGNSSVSRAHAKIVTDGKSSMLVDNGSTNKTFLQDMELEAGKEYKLSDGDEFIIANEKFIYHLA